jgi:hypothetical protein
MYCHTLFERSEGLISIFSVRENKKVFNKTQDIVFKVFFNEKDFELQCTCCLFEFKGILCRHILCVLTLTGKAESVPPCYILSRWRKDIKRRHTLIKCGFDHLARNPELQRVNKACDAFYEVASTRINTEDDLSKVINWIEDLKTELPCKKSSSKIVEQDSSVQNHMTRILDPLTTRSKGRPPEKRKASKLDQIVKKKIAGKKTQKRIQKSKNDHSQEEVILNYSNIFSTL